MLVAIADRAGLAAVVIKAIQREGGLRRAATAVGIPHSVLSLWRRQARGRASSDYLGSLFDWAWKNAPDLGGLLRDALFDSAAMRLHEEYKLWLTRAVGSQFARKRHRCVALRDALRQADRGLSAMLDRFELEMREQGIRGELQEPFLDEQRLELAYQRVLCPFLDAEDSGGVETGWREAASMRVPGRKRKSALHVILEMGLSRELLFARVRPTSPERLLKVLA